VENPGSVAGGGAIEIVAEEGEIVISNKLFSARGSGENYRVCRVYFPEPQSFVGLLTC